MRGMKFIQMTSDGAKRFNVTELLEVQKDNLNLQNIEIRNVKKLQVKNF